MAISINWLTRVITVPRADMTLVQTVPTEVRELKINDFRLALKDIEDDEGMPFQTTHNHYPEVAVGGLVLARVVELLPPYTVTFEDGQYAVNLIGANSNIGDRVNPNQVSVRSFNSAGMTSSPLIEYASFNGMVTVDVVDGTAGTMFPTGTPLQPVNNMEDALTIAVYRGFGRFHIISEITLTTGQNFDGYTFETKDWTIINIQAGVGLEDTVFEKASLYGVMGGYWNVLVDCWIYDITNFCGWVRGGSIESVALSPYTVDNLGQSFFDNIVPMSPGVTSTLTMNTDTHVSFTDSSDITTIKSMTTGSDVECGLDGGELIIDATCTGGDVTVLGVGSYINNSALVIDDHGFMSQNTVSQAVWDEPIIEHVTADTTGFETLITAYEGHIHCQQGAGSGTSYPYGTKATPVGNIANALTISALYNIKSILIEGAIVINGENVDGITFFADRSLGNSLTIISMVNAGACYFTDLTVSGALTGQVRFTTCVLGALTGYAGGAKNCLLTGNITVTGSGANYFTDCDTYVTANTPKTISAQGEYLNIIRSRGMYKITDYAGSSVLAIDLVAGSCEIDSTCVSGDIVVSGVCELIDNSGAGCTVADGTVTREGITDDVWDEATTDHTTAGSTGKALSDAGASGNPWGSPVEGNTAAGTFGELVGKKLLTIAKFLGLK